jgi:hypothetical protein
MALLGLSACAELGVQFPDFRDPETEAVDPVPVEQALSNAGRFPEDVTDEAAQMNPPPPLPVRKPEVPAVALATVQVPQMDPDVLVGLDFKRTTDLLGEPALLIEEPPAKIWAYNGSNCVLHVFFYPKVGGSDFRVLTYEVKGGSEEAAAEAARSKEFARLCLSELLVQAEAKRVEDKAPPAETATGAAGDS